MPRFKFQGAFKDQNGRVVPSGTISVYLAGTTTAASVYTTEVSATAVNSVTSDTTNGTFSFWVDTDDYAFNQTFKIILSKSPYISTTYDDLAIFPDRGPYYYLTDYDDLEAAADALNALGVYVMLVINDDVTMDADVSFDTEVVILPTPGNIITLGAYNLTVVNVAACGNFQWVDSSGAGTFTHSGVQLKHDSWTGGTDNTYSLGSTGVLDLDAGKLILDADADTYIRANTDDEIDLACSGTIQAVMKDGSFEPETTNDLDLGSTSKFIKNIYANNIYGATLIHPYTTGAVPLGSASKQFQHGYIQHLHSTSLLGYMSRPMFFWGDADTIQIFAGAYHHSGTTDQIVYWNSLLTFDLGPAGSNADSSAIAASDAWHYIYLDDSAIVTNASPLLVAACFLSSTTAPTHSAAKHGWYNGSDRCIFAVKLSAGSALAFWHDGGDFVEYSPEIVCLLSDLSTPVSGLDIDDTATDVVMIMPNWGALKKALARFETTYINGANSLYYRINGVAVNNVVGKVAAGSTISNIVRPVYVDSSQKIEVQFSSNTNNTFSAYTLGYYLPLGM